MFTNAKKQFKYRDSQQRAQFADFPVFIFALLVYCTEKSYLTVTVKVRDIYQLTSDLLPSVRFVSFRLTKYSKPTVIISFHAL